MSGAALPLQDWRIALLDVAADVGAYALDAQRSGLEVAWKKDASPVTQADQEADRRIVSALRALAPDIPVVSEEGELPPPEGLRGLTFWLVDPIDGTRGYAKGGDEWTVNIALIERGVPVLGIVGQPAVEEIYSGIASGEVRQAWKRAGGSERRIAVREVPEAGYAMVVSHRGAIEEERARFAHLTIAEAVRASSSLKFCRVAEGAADLYPRGGPTSEWDTAAGHAILRGAGGEVFDYETGEALAYTKAGWLNGPFVAVGGTEQGIFKRGASQEMESP